MATGTRRVQIDLDLDMAELHALERRVVAASPHVLDTGDPSSFRDFLEQGGLLALEGWRDDRDGALIAYFALAGPAERPELRSVAVDPRWQRRGLGREIVRRAVGLARLAGARTLELATSPENSPALALYESEGFRVARRSANHYGDGGARLILERRLP